MFPYFENEDYEKKELEILKKAVGIIEEKKGKEIIQNEEVQKIMSPVIAPIVDCICGKDNTMQSSEMPATVRADDDKVFIDYASLTTGTGYVSPAVMLEFGARSTGEPSEMRDIRCDAAAFLDAVTFPTATPAVMRPERTFWEKATAIHVFCAQGAFRGGDRFARHWHDVTRLDAAGFADAVRFNNKKPFIETQLTMNFLSFLWTRHSTRSNCPNRLIRQ